MREERLWKLIEQSRRRCPDNLEGQIAVLTTMLENVSAAEIVEFDRTLEDVADQAHTHKLWGAASLLLGDCTEDRFFHFRLWLVAQGREVFERALEDPDSLAALVREDGVYECEQLVFASASAYAAKTKKAIPPYYVEQIDLKGKPWTEIERIARLPKLARATGRSFVN
jgi:hypothetical protein